MTKKKRARPNVEEALARPWCFYCERDFDDLKILIQHQKARHFKCETCGRRLNTAGGLSVHLSQVHKETLAHIENTLDHRKDAGIEIFGMEGIPQEMIDAHRKRVLDAFYKEENARRAETGNPPPGANAHHAPAIKKPKVVETKESIKERLARFRANRAAERQGIKLEGSSGANSPDPIQVDSQSPVHIPAHLQASDAPHQSAFSGQPLPGSPYGAAPSQPIMIQHGGWLGCYPPPPPQPPHSEFVPQDMPIPGPHSLYPLQYFPSNSHQSPGFPPHPSGMPPGWMQNSSSPVPSLPQTAPKGRSLPPPAPGLPARPSFEPPQPKQSDYHRMHHGRGAPLDFTHQDAIKLTQADSQQSNDAFNQSIEELIKSAKADNDRLTEAKAAELKPAAGDSAIYSGETVGVVLPTSHHDNPAMAEVGAAPTQPTSSKKEGKDKKKKDKKSKELQNLVYSDNITSPEEKMAAFPKFTFEMPHSPRFILDEAGGAVTGVTVDEDTVLDAQNSH